MKELFGYIFKLDIRKLFLEDSDNIFIQFFRYVFVGGIAFIVDWGSLYVIEKAGVNYLVAAIFAFIFGLVVNFILSKCFVFKAKEIDLRIEFIAYAVIGVMGLCITEILMYTFTDVMGIYFMVSKLIAAILVLIWNFFARKIILYRGSAK